MTHVKVLNSLLWVILTASLASLAWLSYLIATAGPEVLRHSPVFWLNLATYPLYFTMRRQQRRAILTAGLAEVRDGLSALAERSSQAGADQIADPDRIQAGLKR